MGPNGTIRLRRHGGRRWGGSRWSRRRRTSNTVVLATPRLLRKGPDFLRLAIVRLGLGGRLDVGLRRRADNRRLRGPGLWPQQVGEEQEQRDRETEPTVAVPEVRRHRHHLEIPGASTHVLISCLGLVIALLATNVGQNRRLVKLGSAAGRPTAAAPAAAIDLASHASGVKPKQ